MTQVNRGEFELILASNLDHIGKSRIFISLYPSELEILQQEIKMQKIPSKHFFWGYPVIQIQDPDGNEMLFPVEQDT